MIEGEVQAVVGGAARLDDEAQAALEREVVARGEPFTDGDDLVMELDLVLTTARP